MYSASGEEYVIVTHEPKVVASVFTNILHDVTASHPFRDHREPPFLEGVRNANKIEDIRMGQILPHGDFFTEVLCDI